MERAVFGPEEARRKGMRRPGWAKVVAEYRLLVYGAGEEMAGGAGPEGESKGKRGFSREEEETGRERVSARGSLENPALRQSGTELEARFPLTKGAGSKKTASK